MIETRSCVVGHNPGTEELFFQLTGIEEHFPTATLANIALEIDTWRDAGKTRGKLQWLVRPRQLEFSDIGVEKHSGRARHAAR